MSKVDVLLKLRTLDFETLTEERRRAAVAEVRAQIAEISSIALPGVDLLVRKISFLKIWQKLERLRVVDVQADVAPPIEIVKAERMFAPEPDPTDQEVSGDAAAADGAEQDVSKDDSVKLVSLRLVEEGKATPSGKPVLGPVIEVTQEHASHLLADQKAVLVKVKRVAAAAADAPPEESA